MSQENVEAFKRATEAFNLGDVEAALEEIDPEVEWHPVLQASVAGSAAVYRGHEGVREMWRDTDQAFDIHIEYSEIRDLGDRIVALGHVRAIGTGSGAVTESPLCYVVEFRNAKAVRIRGYLDPAEALEAAGLREQAMSQENVEILRRDLGSVGRLGWVRGSTRPSRS